MPKSVPPIVYLHLVAAASAFVLGAVQLARSKGTPSHRALGWTWVALMLTVAVTSLWIPSFLHLTWIHVFTLLTLVSLPLALVHIRRGNVAGHAGTMKGLYIGGLVIAGAFAFVPGRVLGNLLFHGTWGY